jgi:hypothetical protein
MIDGTGASAIPSNTNSCGFPQKGKETHATQKSQDRGVREMAEIMKRVSRYETRLFRMRRAARLAGLAELEDALLAELAAGAAEEAHTDGDVVGLLGRLARRRTARLLQDQRVPLRRRVVLSGGLHLRRSWIKTTVPSKIPMEETRDSKKTN